MTVDNTSKSPHPEWLFGRNPDAIEAQEAEGQRQLVASNVLPVPQEGWAVYEELGFTFGGQVEDDELFVYATLPPGWQRVGSDHSMWSYIVDTNGVRRVAVFYKAAFYDRKAYMCLEDIA